MLKSNQLLEDLYLGNHILCEKIQDTENYKTILNEFYELLQTFEKTLTDKQKEVLNNLIDYTRELECEATLNHFVFGFKTGLQVGFETFN